MEVEQKAAIPTAITENPNLGGELVLARYDLLRTFVLVALERLLPFAGQVIPENQTVTVEAEVQAVVDAFFGHESKTIK